MRHKNPDGYWDYGGNYTVELTPTAETDELPDDLDIEKKEDVILVQVKDGGIKQQMGGIQFFDHEGNPFSWGYPWIQKIYNSKGELLWENQNQLEA
ncbi:MAG: hypothetical protein PHN39_03900 [Candidatus Pacebacteria bacterium]|nr:hypothetical protein [Candidatus Paceibacterota bacterium]